MKTTAAFFDIDGTLYRDALITETFKKLIRNEIIDSSIWHNEVKEKYNKWTKRMGDYDDYLLKMAEIYTNSIKGLHQLQIRFIAQKIIEQKGDKVYIYTRDKIKWHLEKGHKVIGISGSPMELVEEMANKHHFDDFTASKYIVDDNKTYTGEVIPMWDSESKKKALSDFVNQYYIDLSKSYAYGDTAGDFSMLQSVGHPVAMNPTRELINKIKEDPETSKKAMVIIERKDMIYELKPGFIK
jgi:HAD superfamily hydrolase (TIGR01490 family)